MKKQRCCSKMHLSGQSPDRWNTVGIFYVPEPYSSVCSVTGQSMTVWNAYLHLDTMRILFLLFPVIFFVPLFIWLVLLLCCSDCVSWGWSRQKTIISNNRNNSLAIFGTAWSNHSSLKQHIAVGFTWSATHQKLWCRSANFWTFPFLRSSSREVCSTEPRHILQTEVRYPWIRGRTNLTRK